VDEVAACFLDALRNDNSIESVSTRTADVRFSMVHASNVRDLASTQLPRKGDDASIRAEAVAHRWLTSALASIQSLSSMQYWSTWYR
jgi:hypothetical protein